MGTKRTRELLAQMADLERTEKLGEGKQRLER